MSTACPTPQEMLIRGAKQPIFFLWVRWVYNTGIQQFCSSTPEPLGAHFSMGTGLRPFPSAAKHLFVNKPNTKLMTTLLLY